MKAGIARSSNIRLNNRRVSFLDRCPVRLINAKLLQEIHEGQT